MGYQGALKRKPEGLKRTFIAAILVTALGTLVAWASASSMIIHDYPVLRRVARVSWWLAAAPFRIIERFFGRFTNSNPADASPIEIAGMCLVNGVLVGIFSLGVAMLIFRRRTSSMVQPSSTET